MNKLLPFFATTLFLVSACVPAQPSFQQATPTPGIPAITVVAPGATTTPTLTPLFSDAITIRGVHIQDKSDVRFRGESDLPDGTCILTQLYVHDRPAEWWPSERCARVKDGRWEIQVRLSQAQGAPEELSETAMYILQAWQKDHPAIQAQYFPFDLQGPPTELAPGTPIPTRSGSQAGKTLPEQDWLIFIASQEGYPAVYAARPDGSGLTKLMDEYSGIFDAALSPDGTGIAFSAHSPMDGAWDIFIMNMDGTGLRNLTTGRVEEKTGLPRGETNPTWSPEGQRLAFSSDGDIFVIAVDGSGLVQLTDHPGWEGQPSWSPDGTRLVFASDRDGQERNYFMNADGSGQVPLPEPLAEGRMAAWGTSEVLSDFASAAAPPTVTPAPTEVLSTGQEKELALQTLFEFFDQLHAGEYDQAAQLYGGSYEILMDWYPTLSPKDRPGLLRHACERGGLQCLRASQAVFQEQTGSHEFTFLVEFMWDGGSRFVRGPCCGATETEMPPDWQFPYTVKRIAGQFQVMELPVYVP